MIQPLGKRILISPITPPKKESIILTKDEAPQTFEVIAIGDDVKKVEVSDTIFIAGFSTSEFKYNDIKYTMVSEDNIIAKIGK
jgi:co-chaperonin GroES (HSP10)